MESAEAARRRSSDAASAACVESAATAAGAFDASGLTVYLKDVVTLCLENRPEDPVAFVAEYLRRVTRGASPVSRACQYLRLAPHHRRAFVDNAVVAHAVLCGDATGGPAKRLGVHPEDHRAVLREICARLPPRVARTAARGDGARRHRGAKPNAEGDGPFDSTDAPAGVDFFEFAGSVRACLAFEELLGELEETLRRQTTESSDFDAARPVAREALRRAAETAAGGSEGGGGRDARAEAFLEAVDVALEAIPEAAVTFERFASELFVAMTPDAEF
jgi:tubulin polyglutamylase complex subunit 1